MIGYILQALLLIGVLYIIIFKIKNKSLLLHILSVIIIMLALCNIGINIAMLILADTHELSLFFSKAYKLVWIKKVITVVIAALSLLPAFTVSNRIMNIEKINRKMKKGAGENAQQFNLETVSLKKCFPENCRKFVMTGVYFLVSAALLMTVIFAKYPNAKHSQQADSFAELEISYEEGEDIYSAVRLLDEMKEQTSVEKIHEILDNLFESEEIRLIDYYSDKELITMDAVNEFYDIYLDRLLIHDNDYIIKTEIWAATGVFDIAVFEYYDIDGNEAKKYLLFVSISRCKLQRPDNSFYDLFNIFIVEEGAHLGYSFIDFAGYKFNYKHEHECLYGE